MHSISIKIIFFSLVLQQIIVVHAVNKTMLLHARLVYCQVLHHKMGDAPLQQSPVKEAK